jgi:hypothetical protein
MKSIAWVEQHPYEVMFLEQFPGRPGNRAENVKQALSNFRVAALKEQQYLNDPKNREDFQRQRKERHVVERFCW